MDHDKQLLCRAKLIEVARSRGTITYKELGEYIGLPPQSAGKYLNQIWEKERMAGRPDLTVVVINADTGYGTLIPNSRQIAFDTSNAEHVKAYDQELQKVYDYEWPD